VHYEDQSTERIPIIYGENVYDWFCAQGAKEPSKAKVAWQGENDFAKSRGCQLRLYASTWTNPKPDQRVMRIDFVGRKDQTQAAPICLAMTAVQENDREAPADRSSKADAKTRERRLKIAATEAGLAAAVGQVPRGWRRQDFNGSFYYIIPLR
jgi:hypothetical protein